MARKRKIIENEKHPLDDLKKHEIAEKREKREMHTLGPIVYISKLSTYFSFTRHISRPKLWT